MLLEDNGSINKKTQEAKGLNKELEKVRDNSSRAMSAPSRAGRPSNTEELVEYNRVRASTTGTGASARDFANQAQGLGGLVRLYAAWAANIFAVSAAFGALREAMNTQNMIEGMNQLGATSGQALGNLSKRFMDATDGAISLREAMEATVKATSSGLSSEQTLQIADIAKKASQALGVNMNDAVSRLTRGITKLEPELLDELAIFTKIGPATENYARSVGKTASTLTDFERRQAFANAVLEEGAKKFGEINLQANPYDKLLAALKNVALEGLTLINKVLVPIISLLSENPTILAAAIALFVKNILTTVIPAIGQWQLSLKNLADKAAEFASSKSFQVEESFVGSWEKKLGIPDLEKNVEKAKKEIASLSVPFGMSSSTSRMLGTIDKKNIITESDISKVTKAIEYRGKIVDTLNKSEKAADIEKVARAKQEIDFLKAKEASLKNLISATLALDAAQEKLEQQANVPAKFGSPEAIAKRDADLAQRRSDRLSTASNAVASVATLGLSGAISQLDEDLTNRGVKGFERFRQKGIGSMLAVGASIARVGSYLMSFVAGPLAVGIAAFFTLDMLFSKNSASLGEFSSAVDSSKQSIDSAQATVKKYGDNLISIAGIGASSNAIREVANEFGKLANALAKADAEASPWDRFIDGWKTLVGMDLRTKFEESMIPTIESGINAIADPRLKKQAEENLKALLNIDKLDKGSIRRGVESAVDIKGVGQSAKAILESAAQGSEELNKSLLEVKESFSTLDKDFQDLSNSLSNKDPFTKLGRSMINQTSVLEKVFEDPIKSTAILKAILEDTSKIRMFPAEFQNNVLNAAKNMSELEKQAIEAEAEITAMTSKLEGLRSRGNAGPAIRAEIALTEEKLDTASQNLIKASTSLAGLRQGLVDATKAATSQGFDLLTRQLSSAVAKASIGAQKALLQGTDRTPESIKFEAGLDKKAIDLQIEEINVTQNLANQMELTRLTYMEVDLAQEARSTTSFSKLEEISKKLANIARQREALESKNIVKDLKSGKIERSAVTASIIERRLGVETQKAGLSGQKAQIDIKEAIDRVDAVYDQGIRAINNAIEEFSVIRAEIVTRSATRNLTSEEQAVQTAELAVQEGILRDSLARYQAIKAQALAIEAITEAINRGHKEAVPPLVETLKNRTNELTRLDAIQARNKSNRELTLEQAKIEEEKTRKLKGQLDIYEEISKEMSHQSELQKIYGTLAEAEAAYERVLLDNLKEKGLISDDIYLRQVKQLELAVIERIRLAELADIELRKETALLEIRKKLALITKPDEATPLIEEAQNARNLAKAAADAANRRADIAKQTRNMQEDLSDRMKGFDQIFQNTFDRLADSILQFVETGKFSFKDLVSGMLKELVRLELKMQTMEIWKGIRGKGFLNWLSSLSGQNTSVPTAPPTDFGPPVWTAKGGAFNGLQANLPGMSLEAFANGGMFTNSVVSQPTMFKFAKGSRFGVMGEAGPEAVMPLKRDKNGVLGVRAKVSETKVDVVVNNYSGAQATATETTDSRGNRRIEVTVSEMVAGEMIRPGTSTNQAVRAATGSRPYVVRR